MSNLVLDVDAQAKVDAAFEHAKRDALVHVYNAAQAFVSYWRHHNINAEPALAMTVKTLGDCIHEYQRVLNEAAGRPGAEDVLIEPDIPDYIPVDPNEPDYPDEPGDKGPKPYHEGRHSPTK